jgi:hypothetical protein
MDEALFIGVVFLAFPIVVVNTKHRFPKPVKGRDIFASIAKFISDSGRDSVLDDFTKCAIVPSDTVLVFGELNEISSRLTVARERDRRNSIFVVVLGRIRTKQVSQLLDKSRPTTEKVVVDCGIWFVNKRFEIIKSSVAKVGHGEVDLIGIIGKFVPSGVEVDLALCDECPKFLIRGTIKSFGLTRFVKSLLFLRTFVSIREG